LKKFELKENYKNMGENLITVVLLEDLQFKLVIMEIFVLVGVHLIQRERSLKKISLKYGKG
jgi:hypothetical protein